MKLSRLTIPYNALRNSSYILFIIVFTGSFPVQNLGIRSIVAITMFVGFLLTLSFVWSFLVWRNYSYWLDKDTLRIKQGVIRKKNRRIPKKRVQNVDVTRNIIQRVLGISQVKLETAGGGKTEAALSYLEFDKAKELREDLKEPKDGEERANGEKEKDEPIYEISDKELALLSLTSVDLRKVFGLFFLFGFAPSFFGGYMEDAGLTMTIGTSILLVTLALFTFVSSGVSTFLQYWGFKLYKERDNLQYERGLLNRSEGSIPLNKIQRVTLEENFLKRLIGYSSLKIDTAGYSPGESMEKGSEAAVPIAKKQRSLELANMIAGIQKPKLQSIGENAKLRYTARYLILSALILAVLIYLETSIYLAIETGILLVLLSFVAAKQKWINKGFKAGENHCVTLNGFWNKSTNFIPYFRVQNIIETQSVLQKRLDLATVDIDTAGTGNLLNKTVAVDLEYEDAKEFREYVFEKFKISLE